jgi:hypothetical protein
MQNLLVLLLLLGLLVLAVAVVDVVLFLSLWVARGALQKRLAPQCLLSCPQPVLGSP